MEWITGRSHGAEGQNLVIAHKDRFMRFGYDWFERFCMHFPVDYMAFVNIKSR